MSFLAIIDSAKSCYFSSINETLQFRSIEYFAELRCWLWPSNNKQMRPANNINLRLLFRDTASTFRSFL